MSRSPAGTVARPPTPPPSRGGVALLAVAVALAAVNLRPAVASVGPVLDDIRADVGLSGAAAALLTALPVLCFGAGALVAPRLARRFGTEAVVTAVLATTAVGILLRLGPGVVALYAGTFLAGASIAVMNVLIPALVKREFPARVGAMMGVHVSVTVGGAAVAAAVTVPLSTALGGWRAGLAVWAIPAALACAVWLGVTVSRRRRAAPDDRTASLPASLGRDRLAWQVTGFMGLQSVGFYALLAWLPSIYRGYGLTPEAAGALLSLMVVLGVPTALVLPSLVTRSSQQRGWTLGVTLVTAVGYLGLLVAPEAAPQLWAVLFGLGLGASFPLALTLVVLRSRDAADAAQLSAMSQSVGYALAAGGPFLFGVLHDASGGWTVPVLFLLAVLVPQAVTGWAAGRPAVVGPDLEREPR